MKSKSLEDESIVRNDYYQQEHPKDPLDLSFSNTKEAYKSKTTLELTRALLVLKLSSFNFLIANHRKV